RVDLLARRAPGRPAGDIPALRARFIGKIGQNGMGQGLKDAPVAVEARNGDPAHGVERGPLRRINGETSTIRIEISEPQLVQAPRDALADLTADLAKSCPAQVDLRQSPLKERNALGVFQATILPYGRAACQALSIGFTTSTVMLSWWGSRASSTVRTSASATARGPSSR